MIKNHLYTKLVCWLLLSLLLIICIIAAFLGYVVFGSSDGLVPSNIFSSQLENRLRVISTNLQYKDAREWEQILATYDEPGKYRFHLVNLDESDLHYTSVFVPAKVMEAASRIPRSRFTLCPDPNEVFKDSDMQGDLDAGIAATPPAIFMRTGTPASYWYGRVLFVPDATEKANYLLLAVNSPSISGYGLFFQIQGAVTAALIIIGFICVWWLPMVVHITRPLLRMVNYAEHVSADGPDPAEKEELVRKIPDKRTDEIGRLAKALMSMSENLTRRMTGQQQFIRHIAHELNTPLARCKLGMAILEEQLEGESRQRVQDTLQELDSLSKMTNEVLLFLRAQAAPEPPRLECLDLYAAVASWIRENAPDEGIQILVPPGLSIWGDKLLIRQAVGNTLANALTYGGDDCFVAVAAFQLLGGEAESDTGEVVLCVRDTGPGVPEEELKRLHEPFFRGAEAQQKHPGGSGLGLAIVKSSVEQCRGKVTFANLPGGGFEVQMRFMRGPCLP